MTAGLVVSAWQLKPLSRQVRELNLHTISELPSGCTLLRHFRLFQLFIGWDHPTEEQHLVDPANVWININTDS
jgi:hypothetical protein